VLPGSQAQAETADQARAQAHRVAVQVRALEPRVAAALKAYRTAVLRLGTDVTSGISADEAAQEAEQQVQAAALAQRQRIRALYMSGGQAGLLATLLDSNGPADLVERLHSVDRVLQVDDTQLRAAQAAAAVARADANQLLAHADATVVTARQVEDDYLRLQGLLDQAQSELAALSSRARNLAEAEQAARELRAAQAAAAAAAHAAVTHARGSGIPPDFLALYKAASLTCPGLDWHVLAAIGQVESHHGRSNGPSSSGAEGPMQFLPSTFAAYEVDGNHDGVFDIWDPADSIFTAAHYLCANGAGNPRMLYTAIWHYNHADWYVQLVLAVAADLRTKYPS
jgi:membrane-bound lytic murein transglycosylase B